MVYDVFVDTERAQHYVKFSVCRRLFMLTSYGTCLEALSNENNGFPNVYRPVSFTP